MILTHLVRIKMTQDTDLRRQAQGLEDIASQTVVRLADVAQWVDKDIVLYHGSSDFEGLLRLVSKMLLRDGLDLETQEGRKFLLQDVKLGCNDLTQRIESLSMEQHAAGGRVCDGSHVTLDEARRNQLEARQIFGHC